MSEAHSWRIEFAGSARHAFSKLEANARRRIAAALDGLLDDPRPPSAKRLQGHAEYWRIRVGAYRVIYTAEDDPLVILVLKLGPRGGNYRNL